MKMTFLNLRKLGLVLVAASTMTIVSCGPSAEEEAAATAEAEAMVNDLFDGMEDAMDDATDNMEEATEAVEMSADAAMEEVHEHVEGDGHEH